MLKFGRLQRRSSGLTGSRKRRPSRPSSFPPSSTFSIRPRSGQYPDSATYLVRPSMYIPACQELTLHLTSLGVLVLHGLLAVAWDMQRRELTSLGESFLLL
jgi:hypothetical protein